MYIDDFLKYISDIDKRLQLIERSALIKSLNLADDGKLILPIYANDPSNEEASIYFNTTSNVLRYYDGSSWITLQGSGTAGATGTFTTADAKTVTVTNGIITSIV